MSGNNSTEIVTQKELEGVLKNETFDKNQFLRIYEEWKQTHDTSLFAQLRSMHQNAGYKNKNIVFGSESEMHEIARIVQNYNERKSEVTTTTKQNTNAVAATTKPSRVTRSPSIVPSSSELEAKNSLDKYASYATQELKKNDKTIKDLQNELTEKKFYAGSITGIFDKATLEAVRAFQTSVPNIKYGVDGLVGPVTIGELFGIATPSNVRSSRRGDNESEVPRGNTKASPVAPVRSPQNPADIQPEVNNSVANIRKELTTAYTDFITYTSKIDKWFGAVRDSKDNVDTQRSQLNNKIEVLRTLFSKYENNPNASIQNTVSAYKLNLSYYLVDDLSGVSNNLYKNIGLSQNFAIEVLNQDKKRIDPIPEGKIALFNTLDSLKGTPLGNTIAEAMKQNPDKNIYDIISNPTIKGGWESAYSKIFDKSLQSLDSSIDSLGNDASLNPQQKKALTHLKDIRGKNGWYNLKTENITAMWQFAKVGGAVVAGAAATYLSAGTLGPMAAAGVGALVATGGTGLARGYWDGRETLIDGGINLLSFGGGALVIKLGQAVRGTQIIEGMGKVGSIGTGIAIDGVGNIGIGISGDKIRAHLHGEDLNTWDSLKMNAIPWAIFALALNARGVKVPPKVLADAHSVENSVARAEATAHLGGSPKADFDNIKARGPELENFGKTQQNNTAHIASPEHSGTKPDTNLHADPITPNPGTVNSKTKSKESTESHVHEHDSSHGDNHASKKSTYEWKWKNIDTIMMGDNRKFREIFPFTNNNIYQGIGKLAKGEMRIIEAIHNSAAWIQNQTFSQIYTEIAKPWKGNTSAVLKNSIDNVRTLLISGESGKWMSKDRLGKLGIVVGVTTLDYMTSEEGKKNSDGLLDAVGNGVGFAFQKYALNSQETLKLYQEIILLNWVAILIKESPELVGAAVGITTVTVNTVGDRLK